MKRCRLCAGFGHYVVPTSIPRRYEHRICDCAAGKRLRRKMEKR